MQIAANNIKLMQPAYENEWRERGVEILPLTTTKRIICSDIVAGRRKLTSLAGGNGGRFHWPTMKWQTNPPSGTNVYNRRDSMARSTHWLTVSVPDAVTRRSPTCELFCFLIGVGRWSAAASHCSEPRKKGTGGIFGRYAGPLGWFELERIRYLSEFDKSKKKIAEKVF